LSACGVPVENEESDLLLMANYLMTVGNNPSTKLILRIFEKIMP
jgi:hypothetical protein